MTNDVFNFIPDPPIEGITFRLAEPTDVSQLYFGCYATQPVQPFEEMFSRSLKRQTAEKGYHLLALEGKKVIGSAQLIQQGRRVEIADVIVSTAKRSKGVGTALIGLLEQIALQRDWRSIEIGVERRNERALALYERLGYKVAYEVVLQEGELALILRKHLT